MTASSYVGGEGSPLVLLHGATATWRAWKPVLPALTQRHAVLAPTLAGHHGGSPLECLPAEVVPRIVDDVCRQLDDAGIGQAHMVGNSLGGWVALELARRQRALSVVALSPAGAWELPRDLRRLLRLIGTGARLSSWPAMQRVVTIASVRRLALRAMCEHGDRIPTEEAVAMFRDAAGCSVLAAMIEGAPMAGPIAPFVDIDCPIRIAWAAKDRTIPYHRYGRPMMAAVPQAELVAMPNVGHVPMYDDPELVAATILAVTDAGARSLRRRRAWRRSSR